MAKPTLHESDGLLNPNNNMDRSVDNDSKESTKKMDDWKVSLISGSCACTAVFIINLGLTIWSGVSLKDAADSTETSRRIMYEGTCSTTRNINLVIHLIINVFGSILLSASNYGMQCLSTPTRADVDRAHAQGKWVDIGIPSFRFLTLEQTSAKLTASRLNSVVYSSLSSYSYEVFGADRNLYLIEKDSDLPARKSTLATFKSRNMLVSQLDNLTASECINEYGTTFQTKRADVILVFDFSMSKEESNQTYEINSALSHNVRRGDCIETDYDWICANESCDTPCHFLLPEIKRQPDNWKPYRLYDNKVKYCLSQPAPQRCRLNFDITLASIVLVVNFVKAIILAFIAFRPPKEPLFVLGDAIQSFMTRPEENPRGSCLISAHSVRNDLLDEPGLVHTAPKRRGAAISYTRWFFSLAMYGVTLGVSCWLLYYGISQISDRHDFKSLWGLGFGTANELTLITGWGFSNGLQHEQNIFRQVLVSNIPQFIFSMLYFHYNSLYTAMAAAKEWSDFGHKRRPLRVSSSPREFQYQGTVVTCGYSPIAIICVIITSGLMAVAVFTTALRRLPTGMPVAASCSVAIAPACRQPDGFSHPEEAPLLPLQWGVMTIEREGSDREITDHCGFSHESVEKPEDGHAYY
ncbi:hypothetical protein FGSG_02430 [Fusarium graminearum PH-1]|uniref:hypothetical protein n=1 Tax=Gibberella zeae (strain ATCC MYA-4620 / CBS 123657 / FGSC 9075 / NRRL 31084 / PH-1) TaxID=229533 RepID=UPI000023DC9B|nr:hypothetical protein FGSG_02430 [Fusarium graminearum PH-1]ESU07866.1 hypothetical protein FGSG_02430 [Fusarium graminearum PH-1]|eukprot:XP_011318351.1 hypothetical protein FGSG_02430 [Fusarium graminearum PH-1]